MTGPTGGSRLTPAYRCAYVAAYAEVKARWGLSVTPAQATAIAAWSARCGTGRPAA